MAENNIQLDKDYIRTPDAILRIIEMILSLIVFICGCVWGYRYVGGWLQFCGIFAFLIALTHFILRLLSIVLLLPPNVPWTIIEMITCLVLAVFFLICGIVSAIGFHWVLLAVATIFSFLDMVAFLVNAFFLLRAWQEGSHRRTTPPSGTSTQPTPPATTPVDRTSHP